jgi:hypothetical protein
MEITKVKAPVACDSIYDINMYLFLPVSWIWSSMDPQKICTLHPDPV